MMWPAVVCTVHVQHMLGYICVYVIVGETEAAVITVLLNALKLIKIGVDLFDLGFQAFYNVFICLLASKL